MGMGGKVVVSVVSLILVVGVIIGAVAVIKHGEESKPAAASSSMKSVTTFCGSTNFKDACAKSVESAANNATATPKDYLMAAINATIQEIQKALEVAKSTKVDPKKDSYNHVAVEDCKELLGYANDELQAALSTIGDSQLHTLNDRVDELLNWLSAVYTYQSSCLDEFDNSEIKNVIQNGMLNATQLTDNAVSLVAQMSDLMKAFNITLPATGNRRLLQNDVVGHEDGFPNWFPAADRKLLATGRHRAGRGRRGGAPRVVPNAVVAKDGSGQFHTISAALAAYPPNLRGRYIIYVKAGVYDEKVIVDKKQINVFIYGDGVGRTIVTGKLNYEIMHIQTSNTATFSVLGDNFIARGMTFRNTAGPEGHQAVALRILGDMAVVYDCSMEGFQDTLYYQTHRQFYRNCVISGTVDFIFGKGSAVIQNSRIIVRKGLPGQSNTVTADGRELKQDNRLGLVIQNCQIVAEDALFPVRFQVANYLGRPWKPFAKTVIMQTDIGDLIRPMGYLEWPATNYHKTCEYFEFANRGPGAVQPAIRNKNFLFSRFIGSQEANLYTVSSFIQGNLWLPSTGVPFTPDLRV